MFLEAQFSRQFSTGHKELLKKDPVLFYYMVTSLLLPQVCMFNSDDENTTNILLKGKKKLHSEECPEKKVIGSYFSPARY